MQNAFLAAVLGLALGLANASIPLGVIVFIGVFLTLLIYDLWKNRPTGERIEVTSDKLPATEPPHALAPAPLPLPVPASPETGVQEVTEAGKRVVRDYSDPEPGSLGYIVDGNDALPPVPNMGRTGRAYQGPKYFRAD